MRDHGCAAAASGPLCCNRIRLAGQCTKTSLAPRPLTTAVKSQDMRSAERVRAHLARNLFNGHTRRADAGTYCRHAVHGYKEYPRSHMLRPPHPHHPGVSDVFRVPRSMCSTASNTGHAFLAKKRARIYADNSPTVLIMTRSPAPQARPRSTACASAARQPTPSPPPPDFFPTFPVSFPRFSTWSTKCPDDNLEGFVLFSKSARG